MCGVQGCCPVVKIEGSIVRITDDDGNVVKMTKAQFDELIREASEEGKD
jgi:hypothetical protein